MRGYFLFISLFLCSVFFHNANAVGRLQACNKTVVGGTGLDGSNCDQQLICGDANYCGFPTETVCVGTTTGSSSCGIGMRCMTDQQQIAPSGTVGTCQATSGGSAENNALGDVICNAYKIVTGKVGRGIIVVVLFVTGITFYLGKVNWGTIVAIILGAGLCFGGPAIVSVIVGRNFLC